MDLFDLYAKLTLDSKEYNKGLDEAESKASSAGSRIASNFGSKMVTAGKIAATGFIAASGAVIAFTKKAVDAYGEYEQLAGGVETLFKDASNAVIENANKAYATAQLSANQYLDTVTSFSSSLIQSLGGDTKAAASKADVAIRDMSDNANKMGTSIVNIQNAYQGFAKQNYTMLDNLKLGYGGTQEEMKRLLADAEKISGIHYEFGNFADMVDAIHVIQVEMGIAGSSFEEATGTIQGSINMLKASWENFVTGLGDPNADVSALADNLMASLEAVADNLGPVVERIFTSFSNVMTTKGPEMLSRLVQLINSMAPGLISATVTLLLAIAQALVDNIDLLTDGVIQLVFGLCRILLQPEVASALLDAVIAILAALGQAILDYGFPAFAEVSTELVSFLINSFVDLFVGSAYYAAVAMNDFLSGLMNGIHSFFDGIGDWFVGVGENIVNGIVQGLQGGAQFLWDALDALSFGLLGRFAGNMEIHSPSRKMRKMGRMLPQGLGLGIDDDSNKPVSAMESIADRLSGGFGTSDIGYGDSAAGGIHNAISAAGRDGGNYPSTIVVQSVLDGRVIGETSYKYNRQISRALGV